MPSEQLESLISATVDPDKADYGVFVGVLIHEQDLRKGKPRGPPESQPEAQVIPVAPAESTHGIGPRSGAFDGKFVNLPSPGFLWSLVCIFCHNQPATVG